MDDRMAMPHKCSVKMEDSSRKRKMLDRTTCISTIQTQPEHLEQQKEPRQGSEQQRRQKQQRQSSIPIVREIPREMASVVTSTTVVDDSTTDTSSTTLGLLTLCTDLVVNILSFLCLDDLDEFALVSRRCRQARGHACLDQTRTGSIMLRDSYHCNNYDFHRRLSQDDDGIMNNDSNNNTAHPRRDVKMFLRQLEQRRLNEVFNYQRRRMIIRGLDCLEKSNIGELKKLSKKIQLTNVTSLEASCNVDDDDDNHHYHDYDHRNDVGAGAVTMSGARTAATTTTISYEHSVKQQRRRRVMNCVGKSLALILPNLRELCINYMNISETAIDAFARDCPNLEILRWEGSDGGLRFNGQNLQRCRNLRELYLDNSRLYCSICCSCFDDDVPFEQEQEQGGQQQQQASSEREEDKDEGNRNNNDGTTGRKRRPAYEKSLNLLSLCSEKLERVSIRGVKWYSWDLKYSNPFDKGLDAAIPQDVLIRFVRNTPTLRWLQSDLSKENIQHIKANTTRPTKTMIRDYPNIEFC